MAKKIAARPSNDDEDEGQPRTVRGMGDNSDGEVEIDGKKLLSIVEGIEKDLRKKDQIVSAIREGYASGKALGYKTNVIRKLITRRKIEPEKRKEEDNLLALYSRAVGMVEE